jgi:ribosomal protein L30/L7E
MAKLALIRLKGMFSLSPTVRSTLSSFRLDRLYSCTVVDDSDSTKGMIQSCKDFVSYGPVGKESIALLLAKRGKTTEGKKLSAAKKPEEIKKALDDFLAGKKLSALGVSSVFYLAPPRGGFAGSRMSQKPFGPLGKNEKIGELISRMA